MLLIAICVAAVFATLVLAWMSYLLLRRKRVIAATASIASSTFVLIVTALIISLVLNVHTYHRLSYERAILDIDFKQLSPQLFRAAVTLPDGKTYTNTLKGDEWLLEVRVLKWHHMANLFGLDSQYRLDRIRGRYRSIDQEKSEAPSVYNLSNEYGLDLWEIARGYPDWIKVVDAIYGSATYLPMADQAKFKVFLTQSGLIAKPVNQSATQAVGAW